MKSAPVSAGEHALERLAVEQQLVRIVGHRHLAEMHGTRTGAQEDDRVLQRCVGGVEIEIPRGVAGARTRSRTPPRRGAGSPARRALRRPKTCPGRCSGRRSTSRGRSRAGTPPPSPSRARRPAGNRGKAHCLRGNRPRRARSARGPWASAPRATRSRVRRAASARRRRRPSRTRPGCGPPCGAAGSVRPPSPAGVKRKPKRSCASGMSCNWARTSTTARCIVWRCSGVASASQLPPNV